jgi:hypothetical protein
MTWAQATKSDAHAMTRPARTQRCHQPHTIKLIDASIWPRQAKVIAGKMRFLFEVNDFDEAPRPHPARYLAQRRSRSAGFDSKAVGALEAHLRRWSQAHGRESIAASRR